MLPHQLAIAECVVAAARHLWPRPWGSRPAVRMLLAIALQESSLASRRQQPAGPARTYWQLEPQTVQAVLAHPSVGPVVTSVLRQLSVVDVWHPDVDPMAAATVARGLLRTSPRPLPMAEAEAWEEYTRIWRPGKPAPERWPQNWALAGELTAAAWREEP
jgi:hypothetical protein